METNVSSLIRSKLLGLFHDQAIESRACHPFDDLIMRVLTRLFEQSHDRIAGAREQSVEY